MRFHHLVKTRQLFKRNLPLGKHYLGGFESPMSRKEASLILNVGYKNYLLEC
jgi:hypothetical protein